MDVTIVTGIVASVTLVAKALKEAPKLRFDWVAAVLAILQPLSQDFIKELTPGEPIAKLAYKATALVLFLMGMALYKSSSKIVALIGLVFIFLPPIWIAVLVLFKNWNYGFRASLAAVHPLTWFALGLMTFGSVTLIILKWKLAE
jgi:hypothetical protein